VDEDRKSNKNAATTKTNVNRTDVGLWARVKVHV